MSKNMKAIFTLSFLLNIIVLGVLLGSFYKANKDGQSYFISDIAKQEMKKNIEFNRMEIRSDINKIKKYKKELKKIIVAKEFDNDAYDIKINQILEVKNSISQRKAKALGRTLSALPQVERKELSQHIMGKLLSNHHKQKRRYISSK